MSVQCSAEQSDGIEVREYRTVTGSIGVLLAVLVCCYGEWDSYYYKIDVLFVP